MDQLVRSRFVTVPYTLMARNVPAVAAKADATDAPV